MIFTDYTTDQDLAEISVSKLCCLVCWQLLSLMRTHANKFTVRGRHAALSPVQLPSWLSIDIVKKMLNIYQQALIKEIEIMMQPAEVPDGRGRSNFLQSDAGLSDVGSDLTTASVIFGFIE